MKSGNITQGPSSIFYLRVRPGSEIWGPYTLAQANALGRKTTFETDRGIPTLEMLQLYEGTYIVVGFFSRGTKVSQGRASADRSRAVKT